MSEQEVTSKKIKTAHFGELEVKDNNVFSFPDGLLGFEDLNDYVLVSHEDTAPLKWLISVDEPNIGFPLISPFIIDLAYQPGKKINLEKDAVFVVVTLGNKNREMTANMKAPIVLQVETRVGRQIVMSSEKYSTRERVIKDKPGGKE